MKTKIVPSRWLAEAGRRLDPGPYLSGSIEAKEVLKHLPAKKENLQKLTRGYDGGIYNGPQFSRNYVTSPEHGVPFLGSSSMLLADLANLPFLRRKDAQSPRLKYLEIAEGMTLISCSGTIGRMVYARPDMAGMWSSQHIMKVVPDPDRILPGYLYAFLSSRFGLPLVTSGTYGAIIQHIEPEHIKDIPIPRLGDRLETAVNDLIRESSRLRSLYHSLMMSATVRVFESVGLHDINSWEWNGQGPDLGFTVGTPWVASLRALNFNPRFEALAAKIRSVPHRELGSLCVSGTLHRSGRYKRIDADPEFGVEQIGQKQLFWLRTEGRFLAKRLVPSDAYVEPGSILVAARGTLGEHELYCRAEFAWKSMIGKAYSEDLLRILGDETVVERGYLFAFCRSETMFRFLRSISTGTKLQDNHPTLLSQLPVPYPAKAARAEIDAIVRKAADAKDRALRLEDEGIRKVENTIAGEA